MARVWERAFSRSSRLRSLRISLIFAAFLGVVLGVGGVASARPFDLAGNGQLALERLQSGTYGLVLMDMQMPVMGGLAATRAFRDLEQAEGRARTPIVAMTANAFNEDRELCLASGMDDHLPKPIELDRLAQVINRWGAGGENPTLR